MPPIMGVGQVKTSSKEKIVPFYLSCPGVYRRHLFQGVPDEFVH